MQIDILTAFKIFSWGVDYGQLTMEEERESEEWADAFNGYFVARKTAMPSNPIPRRQTHSEKWLSAKRKSYNDFLNFVTDSFGGANETNK